MNITSDLRLDNKMGSVNVKVEIFGFIVLAILNIICNILVCVVIRRSRRVQSTTNYFVAALSISDILFTVLVMPFVIGRALAGSWVFSNTICRIIRFVQFTVPGLIIYLLLSICLDRFYTIIYPLSFKIRRGTAKRMILASWIAVSIHCIICLYVFQEQLYGQEIVCRFYVNITNVNLLFVLYIISIILLQYIFPMIIIGVLYSKVFYHIWKTNGCCTLQRTSNIVSRTKVNMVKLLMLITVITFVFFSPMYITNTIFCFLKVPRQDSFVFRICTWLVFLTGIIKPLLYFVHNANFRRGCREVLCFSGSRCYRSNTYAITIAPSFGKKNFVGVMPPDNGRSSPIRAFDRSTHCDANPWTNNNTVTSYV
ncbi:probable G-protein coupled receptor 19 [Saccostrea cucullata]|uniref:probable G-protein coupled receptor 19 n=1 Tax=Saccostrea cuccullata TaxID=36930 RepID=UPI002ED12756